MKRNQLWRKTCSDAWMRSSIVFNSPMYDDFSVGFVNRTWRLGQWDVIQLCAETDNTDWSWGGTLPMLYSARLVILQHDWPKGAKVRESGIIWKASLIFLDKNAKDPFCWPLGLFTRPNELLCVLPVRTCNCVGDLLFHQHMFYDVLGRSECTWGKHVEAPSKQAFCELHNWQGTAVPSPLWKNSGPLWNRTGIEVKICGVWKRKDDDANFFLMMRRGVHKTYPSF